MKISVDGTIQRVRPEGSLNQKKKKRKERGGKREREKERRKKEGDTWFDLNVQLVSNVHTDKNSLPAQCSTSVQHPVQPTVQSVQNTRATKDNNRNSCKC